MSKETNEVSMSTVTIEDLLNTAKEAGRDACEAIMEVYQSEDFEVERKDDNSPLTLADRNAHNAIVKILDQTNIPVLSEEGKDTPYSERKHWQQFWLVDPLDGTKEFMKRNGEFTVNIALIKDGVPVLGVVAVPVSGDVYYATQGKGAFHQSGKEVKRLPARLPADLAAPGLRVVASRSHMNADTEAYFKTLKDPVIVSAGSSLKFLAVAEGKADLYPRYIPCMEWDTAAADIIIREVGLKTVTAAPPHHELHYNKENLLTPYFICG